MGELELVVVLAWVVSGEFEYPEYPHDRQQVQHVLVDGLVAEQQLLHQPHVEVESGQEVYDVHTCMASKHIHVALKIM